MFVTDQRFHTTFAQDNGKADWFKDARFGMFIHWGLYSAAEGMWKGEPLRYMNNYAEWLRYRNRVSKEEYGSLAKRFDWNKIDPENGYSSQRRPE
ncbi:alpha-L-fucosidase [Sphingobacterium sp. E70]|uniref:alpha-L-fucosidase n=1 Tax=Sphingobacterium sp. E70 TaxID=2853439 RepID=UPI00211B75A2|nr:alpha-L-fucosidase [Sphingobacterium sp. E70]